MSEGVTAASLIKAARSRLGLTQAAFAQQAGVPQSMLCAYETSKRQPSLRTLRRLLEALGLELRVNVARPEDPRPGQLAPETLARNGRALADVLALADALPHTEDSPPRPFDSLIRR